jgi:hypothetical protein
LLFLAVFVLNVLPAFAPPTWATMSFIGLAIPNVDFILFALVAAIAATSGRLVLAKLSRALLRQKILSDQTRQNIDAIRLGIESRPALRHVLRLRFQPSPVELSVYCIWPNITAARVFRFVVLYWAVRELCFLDQDGLNSGRLVGLEFVRIDALLRRLLYCVAAAARPRDLLLYAA